MKRILVLAIAALFAVASVNAQTTEKTKAESKTVVHTKKDGTADKRFKENKTSKTEVHLKKDGTPDMRYKENKVTKQKTVKKP